MRFANGDGRVRGTKGRDCVHPSCCSVEEPNSTLLAKKGAASKSKPTKEEAKRDRHGYTTLTQKDLNHFHQPSLGARQSVSQLNLVAHVSFPNPSPTAAAHLKSIPCAINARGALRVCRLALHESQPIIYRRTLRLAYRRGSKAKQLTFVALLTGLINVNSGLDSLPLPSVSAASTC